MKWNEQVFKWCKQHLLKIIQIKYDPSLIQKNLLLI